MKFFKIGYLEIYFLLISILYFLVIKNTWVFRKITEVSGITYNFIFFKYSIIFCFVFYTIKLFQRTQFDNFSRNILGIILILDFIPSSIFFSSVSNLDWRIYFLHVLMFYSVFISARLNFNFNFPIINKKQSLFLLIIIVVVGTLPYLRYINQIDVKNLFLENIYLTRLKFRDLFDTYSAYTHSWFTRVIIPIIFVFALKYKMKILASLNIFLLIFLYLMGAVKSVLLGTLLVVIFYFLPQIKIIPIITKGLIFLLIISLSAALFVIPEYNFFAVIVFRRLMFLPSLLDFCFFDFFDSNHLYWSSSFLKSFVSYEYDVIPPKLIGSFYFDKPEMGANNGLISDGFANGGVIGVLVSLFIFNLYFVIIKNCKIDSKFFGVFFFIMYGFITSALSTVLITHGGLLLLLLSVFLLREKQAT